MSVYTIDDILTRIRRYKQAKATLAELSKTWWAKNANRLEQSAAITESAEAEVALTQNGNDILFILALAEEVEHLRLYLAECEHG